MRLAAKTIALLATFAALALPAAAGAAERTVTVAASATLKVPNDSAFVGLSVSLERRSRGAALRAVSAKLRAVIAAAQAIPGVGDGDVRTGRISVRKSFHGRQPFYRAGEGAGITLHQPTRAGELVAAAIRAGATGVNGPRYFVGDSEAAAGSALAAAFEKAKARAATLARAAGATLGPALTIDEGAGGEIVPGPHAKSLPGVVCGSAPSPGPVRRAAAGRAADVCASPPPTKPGTSTVSATVRVVFALQ